LHIGNVPKKVRCAREPEKPGILVFRVPALLSLLGNGGARGPYLICFHLEPPRIGLQRRMKQQVQEHKPT
jgi:hypothetical protein